MTSNITNTDLCAVWPCKWCGAGGQGFSWVWGSTHTPAHTLQTHTHTFWHIPGLRWTQQALNESKWLHNPEIGLPKQGDPSPRQQLGLSSWLQLWLNNPHHPSPLQSGMDLLTKGFISEEGSFFDKYNLPKDYNVQQHMRDWRKNERIGVFLWRLNDTSLFSVSSLPYLWGEMTQITLIGFNYYVQSILKTLPCSGIGFYLSPNTSNQCLWLTFHQIFTLLIWAFQWSYGWGKENK